MISECDAGFDVDVTQSTKPTSLLTALVRMPLKSEWDPGRPHIWGRLFFKQTPAWAMRLHIAAEEHAKTYINRSSEVVPFCISKVFYVTSLRQTVFHKDMLALTQAVQAGWWAPGKLPAKAGWDRRKMEGVKQETSDGMADTHRQTY